MPSPLEDLLWHDHRTVLVLGQVTRAVWMEVPGEGFWILMAPNEEAAMERVARGVEG